ncbi:MAG: hypothetical protein ACKVQR_22060, partial [Aquabacterium sp.]
MDRSTTARRRVVSLAAMATLTLVASAAQAQFTWRGFEGTSQYNNFFLDGAFRPPDTMGAIGTTQYLETTNGSVTVYDRTSGAVLNRVGANAFWTRLGQNGSAGDQRVLFDHYTNRWMAIGFCRNVNDVCIGVSDTADALGTWKSTKITAFPSGTADYPTLGMDDKGVYIGTNNFTPGFSGTSLFTIPKADLFGGAPTVANMSRFDTGNPPNTYGYAIQGAVNWQGNTTNKAPILAASLLQYDVHYYTVTGVNAPGATRSAVADLNVNLYTDNGRGRQPDTLPGQANNTSNRLVDTLDDRISANVYQSNGKLYAVHTVTDQGGSFTELRYYVVDAGTGALLSQGEISGGSFDYYQGAIAVNEFGDVVIGFNRSGSQTGDTNGDGKADGRISFLARVLKDDGTGQLTQVGADMLLRVSDVGDYRCGARTTVDTACRQRWGDYAAVTIDPNNHRNFWAIGEYAAEWADYGTQQAPLVRANWHTYIAEIAVVPE